MTEIEKLEKRLDRLKISYNGYLEANRMKDVNRVSKLIHQVEDKIYELQEQEEYGNNKCMRKKIKMYEDFISYMGLKYAFEQYAIKKIEIDNMFDDKNEIGELE